MHKPNINSFSFELSCLDQWRQILIILSIRYAKNKSGKCQKLQLSIGVNPNHFVNHTSIVPKMST